MKRIILVNILILIAIGTSFGQSNFNNQQEKLFEEANDMFDMGNYYGAWQSYMELRKEDRNIAEMNYRIGVCIFKLKGDTYESMRYLQEAADADYHQAYYYLGLNYHLLEKFGMARKELQYYNSKDMGNEFTKDQVERFIDISLRAKEMKANPRKVEIKNLGRNINSEFSDYVPLITKNDSIMLFTSRRAGSTGGEKDPFDNYFEDIYYSLKKDGVWQPAENIGNTINTNTHDACVGLSPDGKTLIIFRTNKDLTGGDLYITSHKNGKWNKPQIMDANINSEYAEASATFNSDGNILYFSSDRPGGFGGKDLYRSVKFGNGDWSLPVNLGPKINTKFDDDAPFLSFGDSTLYFSSKGHNTMGGFDVFSSRKHGEADWSPSENLSYPINTVEDDIYFVIAADDRTAYYSSGRNGGLGGQDIYQVDLLDKSKFITIVKGKIKNDQKKPIKAKITVYNAITKKVQGVYRNNKKTGKYILAITPKEKYIMVVESKGQETLTDELFYDFNERFTETTRDISLKHKN